MSVNETGNLLPQCLSFIKSYIELNGISPSHDEIKDHFGWQSKSNVMRILDALEERNLITRVKNKSRSITVVAPEFETKFLWTNNDVHDVILQFLAIHGIDVADVTNPKNPLQSVTIDFKANQPQCKVVFQSKETSA